MNPSPPALDTLHDVNRIIDLFADHHDDNCSRTVKIAGGAMQEFVYGRQAAGAPNDIGHLAIGLARRIGIMLAGPITLSADATSIGINLTPYHLGTTAPVEAFAHHVMTGDYVLAWHVFNWIAPLGPLLYSMMAALANSVHEAHHRAHDVFGRCDYGHGLMNPELN